MYFPNTTWTRAFFFIAVFQAIICLGLEAYVFGEFESSLIGDAAGPNRPSEAKTIPTYLAIFIFGFIYQLLLVWDGLRAKNTIQVIGLCLYNLGMMIYAAVEMDQVNEAVNLLGAAGIDPTTWTYLQPCLVAVPCILALGTVLLSLVAWKLYTEFAWSIYKNISADLRMKRRFLQYQIYIALLKFDFFFFVGFTVQFLVIVTQQQTYEFVLTIVALVVSVFLLFLAAWICRRESTVGQACIISLYIAGMAYFIFKLARMYQPSQEAKYQPARNSLTTFAVLTVLLLIVTIGGAGVTMANFGKGLAAHVQSNKGSSRLGPVEDGKFDDAYGGAYGGYAGGGGGSGHQLGTLGNRMTID